LGAKEDLFEKFEAWSAKTGWSVENLTQIALVAYEQAAVKYPGGDDELLWTQAHRTIGSRMARELRTDAEPTLMYFFSGGVRRNLSAEDYEEKKKAYMDDHEKAVATGLTDAQGTPLDTREFFPNTDRKNPQYNKPLRPFWQKVASGIARMPDEDSPRFFTLRLRQRQSEIDVPLYTPTIARVNIRETTPDTISATSSTITRFMPAEMPELEELSIVGLLQAANDEFKSDPIGLLDYIDANPDASFVIVEGDMIGDPSETSTGNWQFTIGDVIQDIDFVGVRCFVPLEVAEKVNLESAGTGSRVIVMGFPREGTDLNDNPQATLNANVMGFLFVQEKEDLYMPDEDIEV